MKKKTSSHQVVRTIINILIVALGPTDIDTSSQACEVEEQVLKPVAAAYQRARSRTDADEELQYLKDTGVILPNGLRPLSPLCLQEGEDILKALNEAEDVLDLVR